MFKKLFGYTNLALITIYMDCVLKCWIHRLKFLKKNYIFNYDESEIIIKDSLFIKKMALIAIYWNVFSSADFINEYTNY